MSAPEEPMVSVFHFTSRISSAKIRKYKIATEKGMGTRTPTPGPGNKNNTPSPALGPSTMDPPPPKKKARLSLTVRKPKDSQSQSHSPDAVAAVATNRPKRPSTQNVRYSEDAMDVDDEEEVADLSTIQNPPVASPAASSDLSSLSSVQPSETGATPEPPAPPPAANKIKKKDYSKDFASYYIADDDEDDEAEAEGEEVVEVAAPKPARPVEQAAATAPPPLQAPARPPTRPAPARSQRPLQQPPQTDIFRNHTGAPGPYPTSAREPRAAPAPQPAPLPPPVVVLNDNVTRRLIAGPPPPIGRIIAQTHELLYFLSNYYGPARPKFPHTETTSTQAKLIAPNNPIPTASSSKPTGGQGEAAADTLLAAFGDDEDDESSQGAGSSRASSGAGNSEATSNAIPSGGANASNLFTISKSGKAPELDTVPDADVNENNTLPPQGGQPEVSLDTLLPRGGQPDVALIHGIQFIMNALKSWAHGRLTAEFRNYYYQQHFFAEQAALARKRGPGRPRKFEDAEENQNLPPAVHRHDLSNTYEGRTIELFQQVIESGVLRANVSYPKPLARALRMLYMQIDQLINKSGTGMDPQWQCMSYGAQITAHRRQVEKVKEAQARAQAEIERQHFFSQQNVMQQMGVAPTRMSAADQKMAEYIRRMDEREARVERSMPVQYPHPSSYLASNPMPPANRSDTGTPGAYVAYPSHDHTRPRASAGSAAYNAPSPYTRDRMPGSSTQAASPAFSSMQVPSNGVQLASSPSGTNGINIDKTKLAATNLLSRSGQKMNFSFTPPNQLAANASVAEAFPSRPRSFDHRKSGASTALAATVARRGSSNGDGANGATSPTQQPQPPTPTAPTLSRVPSDTIQVASRPHSRHASLASPPLSSAPTASGNDRGPAPHGNGVNVNASSSSTLAPNRRSSSASTQARPSIGSSDASPPAKAAGTKASSSNTTTSAPDSPKSR
ncbi:hypothetical protein LTR09_000988 [Extremus antarcticus]|uniref:Uncharacterized protein n=1 Tax=Extremus antarcticus TaxID=702011 RepID=A0AAJ0GHW9_9PEZI|nr:hypothetical protein LTR09_000988 [Extremus antarcticus]